MRNALRPEMEILDMGCGPYAVLARYAKIKLHCCRVSAADHCEELLEHAKLADPDGGVKYIYSDLFSNIPGRFSAIVFNAPYIDSGRIVSSRIIHDEFSQKRFSGGMDGVRTIKRFLQAVPGYLKKDGKVLLGVNHYHIRKEVMLTAINKSGLRIVSIHLNQITRACVYELME